MRGRYINVLTYLLIYGPADKLASEQPDGAGLPVGRRVGLQAYGVVVGTGGRDKLTGKAARDRRSGGPVGRREDGQTDLWTGRLADVRAPLGEWAGGKIHLLTSGRANSMVDW